MTIINSSPYRYHYYLALIILLIVTYRLLTQYFIDINLAFDEAYYWGWAQALDFGYYSKPPMLGWLIAGTTSICGDSEICVRLGSTIAYPLTTILIFLLGKLLFDERTGFIAALLFITMPGTSLGSLLITTDALLLFFWTASLLLWFKCLETNNKHYWIALGITAGLGLMSKYTMVLFLPSAVLFLIISKEHRGHFKNPWLYISAFISFLILLPNIIWNIQNDFPTLKHTLEISHIETARLNFDQLGIFLGSQFGVFGLISFAALLWASWKLLYKWETNKAHLLLIFMLVFFTVICIQALIGGANANWAAPMYIAASIITAHFLVKYNKKWLLVTALITNIMFMPAIYHFDTWTSALDIKLKPANDAYHPTRGWRKLGEEVSEILTQYPDVIMLSNSRREMAELIYYVKPHPFDAIKWNPLNLVKDQYDIDTSISDKVGRDFLFVTNQSQPEKKIQAAFSEISIIKKITIPVKADYELHYYVYLLRDFRGYQK